MLQAMGKQLLKQLVLCAKVKSKRAEIIIIQASDNFSKAAEQPIDKAEVIHISQEEISSRISEVIDWSLIKSELLAVCKKNV